MSLGVVVEDDITTGAIGYRIAALHHEYGDVRAGNDVFRGVAPVFESMRNPLRVWLRKHGLVPSLTFFRRSPSGQREPHYIHHDAMMGDWTAILYLNPEPHPGDGTVFWEHKSGMCGDADGSAIDGSVMDDPSQFTERFRVKAQFNRAAIFPSKWFHSRALFENYGTGDDARLIQVAFGKVV